MRIPFLSLFIILVAIIQAQKKDSLSFDGVLNAGLHYNGDSDFPYGLGGRFIPSMNYDLQTSKKSALKFNASLFFFGFTNTKDFKEYETLDDFSLYRLNGVYQKEKFCIKAGLQNIQFGSAQLLRPLMWFDLIDTRDPVQITDGVYALKGAYIFNNNLELNLWMLYGNKNLKGWDWAKSVKDVPEYGGRVLMPFKKGHAAVSYHHRRAFFEHRLGVAELPENKYGFDIKLNYDYSLWLEASWVNIKNEHLYLFSNQSLLTVGVDHTHHWGRGLYSSLEHMVVSYHQEAFGFDNRVNISALQLNYPFTEKDNVKTYFYYDWDQVSAYSLIDWHHKFNRLSSHVMLFWNAHDVRLPNLVNLETLYAGKGAQLMIVYRF